jgi:SAM-dependent methyltransferase
MARLGAMRRMRPVSDEWGFDRGLPVDRWYVEDFLGRFAADPGYAGGDIAGRILEVGGDQYAKRFAAAAAAGGPGPQLEVLHVSAVNEAATVVGDLSTGEGIPKERYDCILCTQTLHVIYDMRAAIRSLHDALVPGGVALVTVPGITPACVPDRDHWGDWWRLTSSSARALFHEVFEPEHVHVEAYGNLLTAMGFLQGLAAEEFAPWELELRDPAFEVLIGVHARRAPSRATR